ncbi:MAG: hypothetical protein Tsb0026_19470 [Sulfuricaulis sp.]
MLTAVSAQHTQVFHDVLGMREDMTVDPLQDDLGTGIGGYDKSIVDQSLPVWADGADFSVQDELAGDILLK